MNRRDAKTVGLIGCGLIGREVLRALVGNDLPRWKVGAVLAKTARSVEGVAVEVDPDVFFQHSLDLIIEAAGPDALRVYGPRALRTADVWAVSGTALASEDFIAELETAGAESGNRLRLLPGAIAGLDGVSATTEATDASLHLSVDLPPQGEGDHIVFTGSVRDAATKFPNHVNVAVAGALAGLGLDRTQITVRQPPAGAAHTLRIISAGRDGRVEATTYPVVDRQDNIHIVASSIVGALKAQQRTIWVG